MKKNRQQNDIKSLCCLYMYIMELSELKFLYISVINYHIGA